MKGHLFFKIEEIKEVYQIDGNKPFLRDNLKIFVNTGEK